jgi:hypothetical protein
VDQACNRRGRARWGLLALSAGAAGAQEVSADLSARLGRQTSAEVRVCADGRVLSGLLGSCGQTASGGTRVTVDAGRDRDRTGIRARARVPRLAAADVSVGARRSRPAGASVQAPAAQADATAAAGTSPGAGAGATASLSRLLAWTSSSALPGSACSGRARSPWPATRRPTASPSAS